MLAKRIIPCLDVDNGRVVKGVNFVNLRDAGDPVELAKRYNDEGADEIVLLDISATHEGRQTMLDVVAKIAEQVFIPLTVGGGISTVEQAKKLLRSGADKIGVNSAAVRNPQLIRELADNFGSQAVVLAVDARRKASAWEVTVNGGRIATDLDAIEWIERGVVLGAGEILLTLMDADGAKSGFDFPLNQTILNAVDVPVIASGGAGTKEHFLNLFQQTSTHAALAASVFHFGEIKIPDLKEYLSANKITVRRTA
ncbi:MAG: imidazole glycerol phosphate synthase subunit HisF [Fimbriimonadaceae bacterium]|nr:MAG: imidazole glycerol phosphate synthase subunit HisF [Fimbriimonadaceae bacterium]